MAIEVSGTSLLEIEHEREIEVVGISVLGFAAAFVEIDSDQILDSKWQISAI